MCDMLKYSFSHIVDNRQVKGLLHMPVRVRDIETDDSNDRTVHRPENMENVMFHSNPVEY